MPRTVDDPGHTPQPQQYQEPHSFKLVLPKEQDEVEDERHDDNDAVQHFELVVEEFPAINEDFKPHLNQEDGENRKGEVVENLRKESADLELGNHPVYMCGAGWEPLPLEGTSG